MLPNFMQLYNIYICFLIYKRKTASLPLKLLRILGNNILEYLAHYLKNTINASYCDVH